jgi:hypothetical protein
LQRTPLRVEQDRGFFEIQNQPEVSTDLLVAAPLNGSPLGHQSQCHPVI